MSKKSKRPRQKKVNYEEGGSDKKRKKDDDWGYEDILRSKKSGRRQN